MDTSKEYIKMCEKAVEVQELWNHKYGDWCINSLGNIAVVFKYDGKTVNYDSDSIWLPRQDQLQGMVGTNLLWLTNEIDKFANGYKRNGKNTLTSMEQLWLAFVMKEKFSKTWNGEDWV